MAEITLDDVMPLITKLSLADQRELVRRLQSPETAPEFTQEMLRAYFERRHKEGATNASLLGRFADPPVELSFEEMEATIREAGTAWEEEIDEFFDNRP